MSKYIYLVNNDTAYSNNKNGAFISNIKQMDFKNSKIKVALTDINYTNIIKLNLGSIEIKLKNISMDEENHHKNYINDFKYEIANRSYDINNVVKIIKNRNIFFKNVIDTDSPQIKHLYELLDEFKSQFQKIFDHMNNNIGKTFFYYISECINIVKDMNLINVNQSIFDKFNLYTFDFRDTSFEKKFISEMVLLISKLQNLINNKHSAINFKCDLIIYDKWSFDDFNNYLTDKFSNLLEFYKIENIKNKILINSSAQITSFLCSKQISENFMCMVTNKKSIEFKVNKKIDIVKNVYIYTDIIEQNSISQESASILQIIKTEGEFSEEVCKSYLNPKYLNVNKTLINSISIILKDRYNKILEFESSPNITLKFIEKK